jgi:hypothetical protein
MSSFQNKQSKERGQEQDGSPGDAVFKCLARAVHDWARRTSLTLCSRCKATAPVAARILVEFYKELRFFEVNTNYRYTIH